MACAAMAIRCKNCIVIVSLGARRRFGLALDGYTHSVRYIVSD